MTVKKRAGVAGARIAESLRAEILAGELAPGERIRQELLAEKFGVSRIPVREALRLLEAEGLVSIIPHSGAWVAKLEAFEFAQIYKLREQVEPLAVRESIDRITEDQLTLMDGLVETMAAGTSVETFLLLDREFHFLTYSGAQFTTLRELVLRFWNSTQHYRRVYALGPDMSDNWQIHAEHRLIVDSIRRRDHELAGTLVREHIRRTRMALASRRDIFPETVDS